MHIGVVFPQTELGGDVGAVRAYALSGSRSSGTATCSPTTTWWARTRRCTPAGRAPTT